ncbi:MAG: FHA domain-containing protein [Propionibacteriaceae bacterium]|nr:FHA domain-containing protein [Propionibacteriaceae bacterium]
MKLRLTVRRGPATHNLMITADGTASVGDIAAAVAVASLDGGGQLPASDQYTLRPLGAPGAGDPAGLDPATPLAHSGIRSGWSVEVVEAAAQARQPLEAVALLRVLSGPDAGLERWLPLGSSTIGRGPDNAVVLTDPLVSKSHARVIVGHEVEVADTNSANGVLVGGQQVTRVVIGPGDGVTLGDDVLSVTLVRAPGAAASTSTDIWFTRAPLVLPRMVPEEIDLPEPPSPLDRQRFPLLAMVAPLIMGVVMYLTAGAGMKLMSLLFVALSPILMLGTYIDQRIRSRRRLKADIKAFGQEVRRTRRRLAEAHQRDRERLKTIFPDVEESCQSAAQLGPTLWWRRREHPEFLCLRLGLGDIPPYTTINRSQGKASVEDCEDQIDALEAEFARLTDAPLVVNLRDCGSLGLCGPQERLEGAARAVMAQLICMHSPADLVVTCLTSQRRLDCWEWLQWLPHSSSPHSPLGRLHLAADPATGKALLSQLEELVDLRSGRASEPKWRGPAEQAESMGEPVFPVVVVLVDDAAVDRGRLTRVAERGPDVAVHIVWLAPQRAELPAACRTYIEIGPEEAQVGQVRQGRTAAPVALETLDAALAERLGRVLAPVVDAGVPVADVSDLPQAVSLVSLVGADVADQPAVVVERWRANQSVIDRRPGRPPQPLKNPITLRATVGHSGTDPFTLDLRSQGPHALVGGTTGAGKSEFLQSWVLGLAAAHSPDRVTFLFVDYKGGSAFARCADLPHTVGMVTDLSPYLVRRALTSLRAELRFREHLLNAKGAKDLVELEKSGDPDCPPSLIIVVDEFAALVSEVPEFVDGVVDVGQRGRSLGLHLVLATQRPAGVIKDNLRANTNLRVALRMADEHDSQDVLGDKMAAFFDPGTPGRGAAKMGPGRISPFQSGYPGAKTPAQAVAAPVEVVELDFGPGRPWRVPKPQTNLDTWPKDIDRLVDTITAAATVAQLPAPRKPWLDELATAYNLALLPQRRDSELVLGVIDDPDRQEQRTEFFRPDSEGNIAFYGAGGSGKTTALRSLALAASVTPRSGEVHLYGLDFGGGGLQLLEPMPNVGSIIDGGDDERVARLFRWLRRLADDRAARYAAARAPTLTDYRQTVGDQSEPRILVLIDGAGKFKAEYEGTTEKAAIFSLYQQLLVDGRGVGLHFAVSAERASAIAHSMASSFQRKLVLRQTDQDGYSALGVAKDVLNPDSPPGRAVQVGAGELQLQLAILGDNINVVAQAREIEALAQARPRQNTAAPFQVAALGADIPGQDMPDEVDGRPVLGVADTSLGPVSFDPTGPMVLWGPMQSGRTNAVHWMAAALLRWRPKLALVRLSRKSSTLTALDLWSRSAVGLEVAGQALETVKSIIAKYGGADEPRLAVFVEGFPDFVGSSVEAALEETVKACRDSGNLIVLEGESTAWPQGYSTSSLVAQVRTIRTGLLLQPESGDGQAILKTELPRFKKGDPPPGRGWWVYGGRTLKIQVPKAGE